MVGLITSFYLGNEHTLSGEKPDLIELWKIKVMLFCVVSYTCASNLMVCAAVYMPGINGEGKGVSKRRREGMPAI